MKNTVVPVLSERLSTVKCAAWTCSCAYCRRLARGALSEDLLACCVKEVRSLTRSTCPHLSLG